MDEAIQVSCIIDKLPPSWKDFKHTLKHLMDELTLVELGSHLCIEESLRMYNDNKGKRKQHDNTRADLNKKSKVTCWKCGKPGHLKKDCKGVNVGNKANGSGTKGLMDGSSNSLKGATVHVCKDRSWFKTYELLDDRSILHIGNESTALVHGHGCVNLKFSSGKIVSLFNVLHVPNIRKNLVSSSVLNNYGYKQVIEYNKFVLSKHIVFIGFDYLSNRMFRLNIVNDNIALSFMSTSKLNDSIIWHARLGHVYFKRMQDMSKDGLILAFDIDTKKFLINSIIESKDAIFDENRFLSLPRPSLRIPNRTEDIGGLVVLEEIIEEIDVKTAFLNGNLDEKVYMNQPQGFIITGNQSKVCKLMKYLYGLKQAPKQWHQKFDEVVLSNGYLLNQADKCMYRKFDKSGKGVIICLYVDDMLIFGIDQVQVDLKKNFLSSKFSMKDIRDADVILGIRIKHESNGISISQSHYIEKTLKKFNYFNCTPVSTPIDTSVKLMPNNG
uniref:Zinc finger, CCHC-type n=1 Tax=Tanacetum cinerariifolium TaxID=118510 RepID=A0A6L2KJQ2_TANCI|nr:zinc finger, CCHC-type [Tanacetum cinerariifolium]GEU75468.1 zinc finger, CCHC-type [Tanacetum cinerariifolium]